MQLYASWDSATNEMSSIPTSQQKSGYLPIVESNNVEGESSLYDFTYSLSDDGLSIVKTATLRNITKDFAVINRLERNQMLNSSDWTQMPDSPLSASRKTEWSTYRQALRDLPNQPWFSSRVARSSDWPTKPS